MTKPSENDDTSSTPKLRIGGWVPEPRPSARPRVTPPLPAPGGRAHAVPPPATVARRTRSAVRRRNAHTVALASVAVGVILAAVVAMRGSAPQPPPEPPAAAAPSRIDIASVDAMPVPSPSFSRAPVFLQTREAAPTRAAAIPTATARTTPSSRPRTTSPTPATPRPHQLTPLPASREGSLRSTGGGAEVFIDFVNARGESVTVYWLDYSGNRRQYAVLEPRQSYRQHTYVGHPWVVTDAHGRGLVCFKPAHTTATATIR